MGGRGWWTVERGDLIRHVIPSGEVDAVLAAYEKKKMPEAEEEEEEEEQEVGKNAAFDETLAEVLQCMANDPTNEDEFQPLKVGLEQLKKRQYRRKLREARARGAMERKVREERKRKAAERKRKTNDGEGLALQRGKDRQRKGTGRNAYSRAGSSRACASRRACVRRRLRRRRRW